MKRQLNLKAALAVLAILLLFGMGLSLLHSRQVVRHADVLLFQADLALKQKRPESALRYFDHYLKYRPNDVEAMARYGLAIDEFAQGPADRLQAVLVLNEVVRRDSANKEARYRLMQCLASLKRFNETITQAEKLLPEWDKKAELDQIIGWCWEAQGDYKQAAVWFRKAIAHDPGKAGSYVLLADILQQRLSNPDEADEVMNALVQARPESFDVYLLRRQFLLQRLVGDDADRAEKDLQQALTLAPDDPDVVLTYADSLQSKRQTEEARKLLQKGLELHPEDERLYKVLARMELSAGQTAAAGSVVEKGLRKVPQSWDLLVLQTDLAIDDGQAQIAGRNIGDMKKRNPGSPLADYFQARLLMESKKWPEAITMLERVSNRLPNGSEWMSRVLVQLSLCYQQVGDAEQQLAAIRRAANLEPGWTFAHYLLGSALLALGRLDEAMNELQQVTHGTNVPKGAWSELVRCLVQRNLQLPEDQRKWDEVESAFAQAVKSQPGSADLAILQADLFLAQKRFVHARKLLEKAQREFPGNAALEIALAEFAVRFKDFEGAIGILTQAEKTYGDSAELRLARLRFWSQQPGQAARESVAQIAENLAPLSLKDRSRLLRELAETWTKLGDPRQAERCWRNLIREQPNDVRARLALLDLCLPAGKTDAALAVVTELRKVEGEKGAAWRYGAAALLLAEAPTADAAKLDQARKHLAEADRLRKDWGKVPLLEARIDELEGKIDDAVKHYQSACKMGERTSQVVRRLVQLLQDQGDFAQAEKELRALEEQGSLLPDLARVGADLAMMNGNPARALTLAQQAVGENSRDFRDYLWLARIQFAARQLKKAEENFNWAAVLGAHSPDPWVALVEYLARTEQSAIIPRVLDEMRKKLPSERLSIALARCQDAMGQPDEAEKSFEQALAAAPNDFVILASVADFYRRADRPDKATPLYQKLIEPASEAPASMQAQARRYLALMQAESGKVVDVQQALTLLDANPQWKLRNAADARVRILVQGFDPAQRDRAIKSLQQSIKSPGVGPDEIFWFAKLCLAGNDAMQAGNLLLGLVSNQPDNPQFLAYYVRYHLENGDANDARRYFQMLEKREPNSKRTKDLKKLLPA